MGLPLHRVAKANVLDNVLTSVVKAALGRIDGDASALSVLVSDLGGADRLDQGDVVQLPLGDGGEVLLLVHLISPCRLRAWPVSSG